tara:strand:+ start:1770 stop:4631 length:2862 start_codon:yes stop_codon:yes gene_type:complete
MAFAYESHDHFVRDSKGNAVRDSKGNPVKTSNALKEEQEPKKPPTPEEQRKGAEMWNSFMGSMGKDNMKVPVPGVATNNNNINVNASVKEESSTIDAIRAKGPTPQDFINAMKSSPIYKFGLGQIPFENELEKFASIDHIFSFGTVSSYESNFPDKTYMKYGLKYGQQILKSGGSSRARKPRTFAEKTYKIDTAYFIDDIEIKTIIAPNGKTRGSNAFNFSFKITEPYSMGQLLQTMQLCAKNAGYLDYLQTSYVLIYEPVGRLDDGTAMSGPKRFFPLKIYKMDINASTGGTVYDIQANAWNTDALSDLHQTLKTDVNISGRNLEEICQSGLNSLTTAINTNLLNNRIKTAKDKKTKMIDTDEYIILFPKDIASDKFDHEISRFDNKAMEGDLKFKAFSVDDAFGSTDTDTLAGTGYVQDNSDFGASIKTQKRKYIEGKGGYSIERSNLSEGIKAKYTGAAGEVSEIGRQVILPPSAFAKGAVPFGRGLFARDTETGIIKKGSTKINTKERTINFRKGTKITKIIEELVLLSDYGKRLTDAGVAADKTGMVDWFRIQPHVYTLEGEATEKVMGRKARIYVYRVVPYRVHKSIFQMPNDAPIGYDKLRENAVKVYNYLYTGQNKDILDFNLEFNNAFFNSLAVDKMNESASNRLSERGGNTPNPEKEEIVNEPTSIEGQTAEQTPDNSGSQTGGATEETPEQRIARSFNEALMNSAVDLLTCEMRIMGDPYFMADSGVGNYNSEATSYINLKTNGAIDHESSEVDVIINFRTPIDISAEGPQFDGKAIGVKDFSGLYKVWQVINNFSGNEFTQDVSLIRRRNQKQNVSAGTVSNPRYMDKKAYEKRLAAALETGDPYKIAMAKADLNGDGQLDKFEEDAMGGIYADLTDEELQNAIIMQEGKADAARARDAEKAKAERKRLKDMQTFRKAESQSRTNLNNSSTNPSANNIGPT